MDRVGAVLLVVIVAGCGRPSDESVSGDTHGPADSAPSESLPSTWDYTGDSAPQGTVDAATLQAALASALVRLPTVDPLVFMDLYGHQLSFATGGCPTFDPARAGQIYWEGDCTSDRGAAFYGWGLSRWDHGVPDDAGGTCSDRAFYFGFGRITDPDGLPLDGWGTLSYDECDGADGAHTVVASLVGEYTAPGATGSWLADAVPVELDWASSDGPAGTTLTVGGGFSGMAGDVYAVRFEALPFSSAWTCPQEPDGLVHLYGRDGATYTVTFDGSQACDGCGVAVTGDVDVGAVCVDFSPFAGWSGRPWW